MGAVLLPGVLGYALLNGLVVPMPAAVSDALKVFDAAPPPPPPPEEKVRPRPSPSRKPEGAASPPNLKSKATEVVAPPPVVPVVVPPPVVVAEKAGVGAQATAGASDVRGPGTGVAGSAMAPAAVGMAMATAAGGEETPPRWRRGRLKDSDYPREAAGDGDPGAGFGAVSGADRWAGVAVPGDAVEREPGAGCADVPVDRGAVSV